MFLFVQLFSLMIAEIPNPCRLEYGGRCLSRSWPIMVFLSIAERCLEADAIYISKIVAQLFIVTFFRVRQITYWTLVMIAIKSHQFKHRAISLSKLWGTINSGSFHFQSFPFHPSSICSEVVYERTICRGEGGAKSFLASFILVFQHFLVLSKMFRLNFRQKILAFIMLKPAKKLLR